MTETIDNTKTYDDSTKNSGLPLFLGNTVRKFPAFSLGKISPDDFQRYTQHPGLSALESDLVTAVFDLCAMDSQQQCDIDQVCARLGEGGGPIKASGVLKRLARLIDIGLFDKTVVTGKRGRRATMYVLQKNDALPLPAPDKDGMPMVQLNLLDATNFLETLWSGDTPRMDDFWCQMISSVLPLEDRACKTRIESTIFFHGEQIPIVVSSRVGSRIPTVRSIKTVIAVLTMVESTIRQRRELGQQMPERWVINVGHVLKLMQLPNEGGNRRTVLGHLKEWENALFQFTELTQFAKHILEERFGPAARAFAHHQLISNLCGVEVGQGGQKVPTQLAFSLPPDLVRRIEAEGVYNMFTITPAFMLEQNPLALAFHLYCRKNIGHKTRSHIVTLRTLHDRFAKGMTFSDFRERFVNMLGVKLAERQLDQEYRRVMKELISSDTKIFKHQVNVLGYITTLSGDKVHIQVDLEDPYLGIRSKHIQLKKRDEREDTSKLLGSE